ncbi:MAG: LysR family transcriptional regulator [Bradymonadaceae bacterium]
MTPPNLNDVWNWLPVFRAVAETEHLPTAAERLNVTTPAISRTIRLLEDRLGYELFNRAGRSLVLNTAGERLLRSVREAMRDVDDALKDISATPLSGPLRISALGVLTNHFVLPALLELLATYPELEPRLENHRTAEANELIRRGRLDAAFYYEGISQEGLSVTSLGDTTASVYCGEGHPLFGREVSVEEMLEHEFSIPAIGDTGQVMDGWPVDVPRKIGMRITLLATNLDVCLSGRYVTVLPDVTAYPQLVAGQLHRLPFDLIDPIPIFAAYRENERPESATRALISAVSEQVAKTKVVLATAYSAADNDGFVGTTS